ncbi:unnamed protein product, partial [Timema podura]|nr:unnamed protein product [Timema podura]
MWRTLMYSFVYLGIVSSHAAFADGTLVEIVLMKGTGLPLNTIRKVLDPFTFNGEKPQAKENSIDDYILNETSISITGTLPNSPIYSLAPSSSFSGGYVDINALNSGTPGSGDLVFINITDYNNQLNNSEHGSLDITQLIRGSGNNASEILDQFLGTSTSNSSDDYLGLLSSDDNESYDTNLLLGVSNGSGSYDINQLIGGSNGSGSYDINQILSGSNESSSYNINQHIDGSNVSGSYDINQIIGGSNGSGSYDTNQLIGGSNGSGYFDINQI